MHIRYFIAYVYHICLQDTIQSTVSLCLLCQAMLVPMPLHPLLLTTRSGFSGPEGPCFDSLEVFAPKRIKGLDPVPREAKRASWAFHCLPAALFVPRGTAKPPGSTLLCTSLSFFLLQG